MSTNTYRIHESHLKEARLPLLTVDCANEHAVDVENIQAYAFIMGLLVGNFMHISTLLVAKFLVIPLLSQEGLHSEVETIGLPLLYGFGTSTMAVAVAVVVLVFMCKRVSSVYYNLSNGRTQISEDSLQDLLRKFECSFIKGVICGVCMACSTTYLIVEQQLAVVPIIFTLLYCCVLFCCVDSGNDDEEDQQTENIRRGLAYPVVRWISN
jgi:hypothetical protein